MNKIREKGKMFFKKNIKRKRTWVILAILLIFVGYLILKPGSAVKNTVTDIAGISDLKETVLATGQVVSNTDLILSFNSTGIVKSLKVKVGDKVNKGEILATIEQGAELAALTSARGALAGANARLRKIQDGASSEDINLSQIVLDQTKLTQETLVKNAYENLLNSVPQAIPEDGTSDYVAPVISGTYRLGKEGKINIKPYYSSGGVSFEATGLTSGTGLSNTITSQPIGDSGLFITFPSDTTFNVSNWVIEIPNKKAVNYLANYNAYQSTLAQAKSAIDQRTAELALKKSGARGSDIDLANADIISAQGQVEAAQARYNNTIITAPVSGTITSVDIKIGQLSQALSRAMILQDVSNLYIETNINEANITNLTVGMPIDITYDSFGPDKVFKGSITKIDPASTLVSGVVNYKVTASAEQTPELRPGMTANMTINVKEKKGVLAIPSRSIVTDSSGNRTIRIITNKRNMKYKQVPIVTGLEGDGGIVEVLSGLSVGDEYVVLIKN